MTSEHHSTPPVDLTWHNGSTARLRNKENRGWMWISCFKWQDFSTNGQSNIQTQCRTYRSNSNVWARVRRMVPRWVHFLFCPPFFNGEPYYFIHI